ncbi:hypothetical protein [Legionella nautarum]|uniref:hypothetical protein n=1 Tax=Legionella nautarum TaxID=45070 RepID=UPI001055B1F8|nr:hypothetical protein [Legionella nautarum]
MTLKQAIKKIRGAISYAWNGFTGFLGRHKYAIGVSLLALVAGAALAASLVFFFPATIGTIIGLTAALPFIGAPVAAFLSSIGLVGAAAVIGGVASAVGMAAGAVGYGVVQTLRFIGNVVIGAYKGARNEVVGEPEEPATGPQLNTAETNLGNAVNAARDAVTVRVDTKADQLARHVSTKLGETKNELNDKVDNAETHLKDKLHKTKKEVRALNKKMDTVTNLLSRLLAETEEEADAEEEDTFTRKGKVVDLSSKRDSKEAKRDSKEAKGGSEEVLFAPLPRRPAPAPISTNPASVQTSMFGSSVASATGDTSMPSETPSLGGGAK